VLSFRHGTSVINKTVATACALKIAPYALHMGQQVHKKRMATKRGRITHQQQLAPCAGHAHVHAADVGEEADLALGVAACQCDGNDVSLLALKRIDGAHAEPALQQQVVVQERLAQLLAPYDPAEHDEQQQTPLTIGVIAPYRAQINYLKDAIEDSAVQQVGFIGVGC
jgi:hypothetical protein